ncbi:MAG: hypothetical protein L6Q54_15345 [Leptospiraceae bacterium]|nr:hypothetical protein [Leptospiraceae bacterium]MCK6382609.1 hypothetical protein [Leptospiraceae bacterium]
MKTLFFLILLNFFCASSIAEISIDEAFRSLKKIPESPEKKVIEIALKQSQKNFSAYNTKINQIEKENTELKKIL